MRMRLPPECAFPKCAFLARFSSERRRPGDPFSPLLRVIGATPESTFNSFLSSLLVFLGRYRHLHWGCVYPAFPESSGFRYGPTGFRLLGFSFLLLTRYCGFPGCVNGVLLLSAFLSFAKAPRADEELVLGRLTRPNGRRVLRGGVPS